MEKVSYDKVRIKDIEALQSFGITEIICDGDNKEISVEEEQMQNMTEKIIEIFEPVKAAFIEVGKQVYSIAQTITKALSSIQDKKLTKKKFMKLLQSEGIQRNEINRIVKNNKEKYTYFRYYNIVQEFSKDKERT